MLKGSGTIKWSGKEADICMEEKAPNNQEVFAPT